MYFNPDKKIVLELYWRCCQGIWSHWSAQGHCQCTNNCKEWTLPAKYEPSNNFTTTYEVVNRTVFKSFWNGFAFQKSFHFCLVNSTQSSPNLLHGLSLRYTRLFLVQDKQLDISNCFAIPFNCMYNSYNSAILSQGSSRGQKHFFSNSAPKMVFLTSPRPKSNPNPKSQDLGSH